MKKNVRKWSREEDQRLLNQIRLFPQNLHKCFTIVSEEIGRTEGAVANRWYGHLSKQPDALCFFTASSRHVSRNRKNGAGVESNPTIWKRFVKILNDLFG